MCNKKAQNYTFIQFLFIIRPHKFLDKNKVRMANEYK